MEAKRKPILVKKPSRKRKAEQVRFDEVPRVHEISMEVPATRQSARIKRKRWENVAAKTVRSVIFPSDAAASSSAGDVAPEEEAETEVARRESTANTAAAAEETIHHEADDGACEDEVYWMQQMCINTDWTQRAPMTREHLNGYLVKAKSCIVNYNGNYFDRLREAIMGRLFSEKKYSTMRVYHHTKKAPFIAICLFTDIVLQKDYRCWYINFGPMHFMYTWLKDMVAWRQQAHPYGNNLIKGESHADDVSSETWALVCGGVGSGKTTLVQTAAYRLGLSIVHPNYDADEWYLHLTAPEQEWLDMKGKILLIDDADVYCKKDPHFLDKLKLLNPPFVVTMSDEKLVDEMLKKLDKADRPMVVHLNNRKSELLYHLETFVTAMFVPNLSREALINLINNADRRYDIRSVVNALHFYYGPELIMPLVKELMGPEDDDAEASNSSLAVEARTIPALELPRKPTVLESTFGVRHPPRGDGWVAEMSSCLGRMAALEEDPDTLYNPFMEYAAKLNKELTADYHPKPTALPFYRDWESSQMLRQMETLRSASADDFDETTIDSICKPIDSRTN